jgi:hypothetical protein
MPNRNDFLVIQELQAVLTPSRIAEDARVGWALFAAALATVLASSPMFLAHFRQAIATAKLRGRAPPVFVFFLAETFKITIFSALAAWAGSRNATLAGLDAPIARALVRHDSHAALAGLAHAVPVGLLLGVVAFPIAIALRRAFGDPRREREAGSTGARLTGLFYSAIDLELWFRWGVLAPAARGFLAAGLSSFGAFVAGTAVSTLAFGAFAIVPVRGAHPTAPMPRVLLRAFLGVAGPSVLCAFALRTGGLECAMFAHAVLAGLLILAPRRLLVPGAPPAPAATPPH